MADKQLYGFELPKWNTERRRTPRPAPSLSACAHVESQLTKDELEVLEVLEKMERLVIQEPLVEVEVKAEVIAKGKEKVVHKMTELKGKDCVGDAVKNRESLIFKIPIMKTMDGESSGKGKGKKVENNVERKDRKEAEKVASGPWNLRSRANKSLLNANIVGDADSAADTLTRLHIDISLTPREIEEDLLAKPTLRRFKRRLRNVQNKLDDIFPGTSLINITADTYTVNESKKVLQCLVENVELNLIS